MNVDSVSNTMSTLLPAVVLLRSVAFQLLLSQLLVLLLQMLFVHMNTSIIWLPQLQLRLPVSPSLLQLVRLQVFHECA